MGFAAGDGTAVNLLDELFFFLSFFLVFMLFCLCEQSQHDASAKRIRRDVLWKTASRTLVFARVDLANTAKVGIWHPHRGRLRRRTIAIVAGILLGCVCTRV